MSIECYNTKCNFHNKVDPFCDEIKCHCENGDGEDIIHKFRDGTFTKRKELTCFTCYGYTKCEWRDDSYSIGGDCLAEK